MWSIVIIDDERSVLQGMKKTIPWDELDARWAGEAADGRQGLELINEVQPDIVITDIYMPVMNGLDMIEQLRKQDYPGKIIILSGYSDFEYARQALRLGVDDYLSKPVTVQTIRGVLQKAINELEDENHQKLEEHELRQKLLLYEPFVEAEWIKNVVTGTYAAAKQAPLPAGRLGAWERRSFMVLAVEIVRTARVTGIAPSDFYLFRFAVCNVLQEVLSSAWPDARFIELHSHHMAVLLPFGPEAGGGESGEAHACARELCRTMIGHIDRYLQLHIQVGLGRLKTGWAAISDSTEEAFQALAAKHRCCVPGMEIYEYVPAGEAADGGGRSASLRPVRFYQQLAEAIRLLQERQAAQAIESFAGQLAASGDYSPKRLQSIAAEAWAIFGYVLSDAGPSLDGILSPAGLDCELRGITSVERLEEWLCEKVRLICQTPGKNENIKHKQAVDFMVQYIHEHYAEDIRLSELADKVFISRNYLSNIFRQATGETFGGYLTKVRMEKAKSLLREGKFMVYEIAEMVGYKNVPYFTSLFKKHTGYSPTELPNNGW
ncbi:response regulator transcription factor [Paenibacillus hamazuiensis]|uniref:response regulator transcription factor n=1 Tax=Paenibacillus hamazuiensis TaxID=2936508 RepID=UPI0020104A06|nr:response regulator transcription factor [Paenibacillus hamazuiensis]